MSWDNNRDRDSSYFWGWLCILVLLLMSCSGCHGRTQNFHFYMPIYHFGSSVAHQPKPDKRQLSSEDGMCVCVQWCLKHNWKTQTSCQTGQWDLHPWKSLHYNAIGHDVGMLQQLMRSNHLLRMKCRRRMWSRMRIWVMDTGLWLAELHMHDVRGICTTRSCIGYRLEGVHEENVTTPHRDFRNVSENWLIWR